VHPATVRATEKYSFHLAPTYVADTIRAYFPTLVMAGNSTVTDQPTQ